jgi:hypothetical protein
LLYGKKNRQYLVYMCVPGAVQNICTREGTKV